MRRQAARPSRRCDHSSDLRSDPLPDCADAGPKPMLSSAWIRDSVLDTLTCASLLLPVLAGMLLSRRRTAACARPSAQAGPPPPPKVTAAEALARDVTEWDEFTGRLEAGRHGRHSPARVGLRSPRSRSRKAAWCGRGSCCSRSIARPVPGPGRPPARRAGAGRAPRSTAPPRSCAAPSACRPRTRCRSKSASAAPRSPTEAEAQVAAVEAALRAAELDLEFTRVTSPIDGRVGRAIVTEGNLVSSGPGEATLLTTVVSLDPIYASFDADEQTFLRYGDLARDGKRANARRPAADQHGARQRRGLSAREGRWTSSTTSSIPRPAPSTAARCSATATAAHAGAVRAAAAARQRRLPRRARRGPRRRHRSRQAVRASSSDGDQTMRIAA